MNPKFKVFHGEAHVNSIRVLQFNANVFNFSIDFDKKYLDLWDTMWTENRELLLRFSADGQHTKVHVSELPNHWGRQSPDGLWHMDNIHILSSMGRYTGLIALVKEACDLTSFNHWQDDQEV